MSVFGRGGPLQPIAGAARAFGRTAAGMTVDVASGVTRAGEAAVDAAAGRQRSSDVLRVQVLILRNETGRELCATAAVEPALAAADAILQQYAGIRVRVVSSRVVQEIPPPPALDPRANRGLMIDDVLGHTEFYRRHLSDGGPGSALVAAPVTVVVVRSIAGHTTGCSLGVSADWVITQAALYDRTNPNTYDETVLAHELGHALNLPHHRDRGNLMFPESSPPGGVRGTALTRWQRALIRANRHVIPGAATPPRD